MIVGPNRDTRYMLRVILEIWDYEVVEAETRDASISARVVMPPLADPFRHYDAFHGRTGRYPAAKAGRRVCRTYPPYFFPAFLRIPIAMQR